MLDSWTYNSSLTYWTKGCVMKTKLYTLVRVLAGLMLVVFGSNKFFGFIEMQPGSLEMGAFMMALFQTGYLMKLVAVVEVLSGISFLLNKYTALMAVVLMPVILNAFLVHLFLDIGGIGGAAVLLLFTIVIMINNSDRYRDILRP